VISPWKSVKKWSFLPWKNVGKSVKTMIKRKIEHWLDQFFKNTKKALLITGARQIGKTYSIRVVGKRNFENFVEINFINSPDAVNIFRGAKDAKEVLLRLSSYVDVPLVKGKTLIFFDEVQVYPEVVTMIKFLVDEGSYQYVMSGSLLGVELNNLRSEPVGYMDVKEMYPLDLEEFLSAIGLASNVVETLRRNWEERTPVDEFVHSRLMNAFRLYLVVGGMPEAVQSYLDTNNLQNVNAIQQSILREYQRDIMKYKTDDNSQKLYIDEIFQLIPSELNAKNKRFILKNLNENARYSTYENSFLWLRDAGVALPTYSVEEPKMPLLLSKTRNLFKLFQSDVGLLTSQFANGIQLQLLSDGESVNFGSVYENVVAQELKAHGFDLYYYNSKKFGELDFVMEYEGQILPIEVKSGKYYERHNALSNVMSSSEYHIPEALVLCGGNVEVKEKVVYMPIYMMMFLEKKEIGSVVYKLDLSDL
jgi:uncharacterized protein